MNIKYTIRCTNCEKEFIDDSELKFMNDCNDGAKADVCPNCETDYHLMDLDNN